MINCGGKRWLFKNIQLNEHKTFSSEEQMEKWLAGKQLPFAMVVHLWTFQRLLSLCSSQFCFFPNSYEVKNNILQEWTKLWNSKQHTTRVQYPAQKAKVSCLPGVTQRNSHIIADFQKMKQDWQISQGTGLRPWGSVLGYWYSLPAGTTETQRGGAASPVRFLLYFFSKGSSRSRLIPWANQTSLLKWPLGF